MSDEDLKAELERLKAENEQLKTQRGRSVSLKVSEKGGVSVYGLGRFPVTLYQEHVGNAASCDRLDPSSALVALTLALGGVRSRRD